MDKNIIGFSTSDLYYLNETLDEKVLFFSELGTNAVEIGFHSTKGLLEYEINEDVFKGFDFISVHVPSFEDSEQDKVFGKLRDLVERIGVKSIVVHYDRVEDFEILNSSGLPFAIENMDQDKACGKSVEELRELRDKYPNLKFVLDL